MKTGNGERYFSSKVPKFLANLPISTTVGKNHQKKTKQVSPNQKAEKLAWGNKH